MAVREEMRELIDRLRTEIGDGGAPPVFSDEELQAALDEHAVEVRYERTTARETRQPGTGRVVYRDHRFARGNFASNVELLDSSYTPLETTTADHANGRWTLAASCLVVFVVGMQFDFYRAAADVFERWANEVKGQIDVHDGRVQFSDSQLFDHMERCAKRARRKAWPRTGRLISTDFCA